MKNFTLILTFLFFLSGCEKHPTISREHSVYESVFAFIISDATKSIVLADTTSIAWFGKQVPELKSLVEFHDLDDNKVDVPLEHLAKFLKLNRTSDPVTWQPIMVTVESWLKKDRSKPGYKVPHYEVSKVAFSETGNEAIVGITHHCPLCGGSWLLYLEFENKTWIIKAGRTLWVS